MGAILAATKALNYDIWETETEVNGLAGAVEATNMILDRGRDEGYSYVWIVEADVIVPKDALQTLLSDGADVAFGYYSYHLDRDNPSIMEAYENLMIAGRFIDPTNKMDPYHALNFYRWEVEDHVMEGWVFAGIGCCLLNERILDSDLRFVYIPSKVGHDLAFYHEAQRRGLRVVLDGRVLCEHLGD